jgi:hypothetical protein
MFYFLYCTYINHCYIDIVLAFWSSTSNRPELGAPGWLAAPLEFKRRFWPIHGVLISVIHSFASPLLPHHFLFSIDIGTNPRATRSLYHDIKRRTQGKSFLLTISSILSYHDQHFAFCIFVPFLLRWSNGMATDIGSLAAGLDGLVVRSGIRGKGLPKTLVTPQFFLGHSLFHCRLSSRCTFKEHHSIVYPLWTLTLTLLVPLPALPSFIP